MCVPLSGRAYEADGGEWGVTWGDVRAAVGGRAAYEADGGEWGVAWGDVRAAIGASPRRYIPTPVSKTNSRRGTIGVFCCFPCHKVSLRPAVRMSGTREA